MPLLRRLAPAHSILQFRAAALQRYNEAVRLESVGDRLAAVYLAGYVAEMLLKAAYFRLGGWMMSQPITLQDIRDARTYAIHTLGLPWAGNNLHDLSSWRTLVIAERIHRRVLYPGQIRRRLDGHVNRLQINWSPELRYQANRPTRAEQRITLDAAEWLLRHRRIL